MALSIVGVSSLGTTSTTLPSHEVGDLIVFIATMTSYVGTFITKPSAGGTVPTWVDIDANEPEGTGNPGMRTAYAVATANNHTSGTWTNSNRCVAIVLRGQDNSPIGGHVEAMNSGTSKTAPAITMSRTDGSSILLHSVGGTTVASWGSPAGYTQRAAQTGAGALALYTKDVTTSDGSVVLGSGTAAAYRGTTIEILAKPDADGTSSAAFFAMF